jgi:hypothetical protein
MATTVRTMRKADFVSGCQQNGPTGTRGSGLPDDGEAPNALWCRGERPDERLCVRRDAWPQHHVLFRIWAASLQISACFVLAADGE